MSAVVAAPGVRGRSAKAARPGGFPRDFGRLSPIRKWAWLKGDECAAMVQAGKLQQSKVEGEKNRLEKASARVARIAPSWARVNDYRHGEPFPPTADDPACQMTPADKMLNPSVERKILWPTPYLSGPPGKRTTYDAIILADQQAKRRLDADPAADRSPSGAAIEAMGQVVIRVDDGTPDGTPRGAALAETELLPESPQALLLEMALNLCAGSDRTTYDQQLSAACVDRAVLAVRDAAEATAVGRDAVARLVAMADPAAHENPRLHGR